MYCNNQDSRCLGKNERLEEVKMKLKSILLADSMFTSRSSLKRIIEEHGFTVVAETEDVQTTVERHAELHLDIIIVNSSPSIHNGYDMLKVFESSHFS